jgi:hypothetical protein
MKRIVIIAMIAALAISPSMAQETCASKAFDKNGRQLAGAALNSFLKKCKREACEPKAVSANGKNLFGAAKNSFMKKCERNAGILQPSTILSARPIGSDNKHSRNKY